MLMMLSPGCQICRLEGFVPICLRVAGHILWCKAGHRSLEATLGFICTWRLCTSRNRVLLPTLS
jgi:hypothetical protein